MRKNVHKQVAIRSNWKDENLILNEQAVRSWLDLSDSEQVQWRALVNTVTKMARRKPGNLTSFCRRTWFSYFVITSLVAGKKKIIVVSLQDSSRIFYTWIFSGFAPWLGSLCRTCTPHYMSYAANDGGRSSLSSSLLHHATTWNNLRFTSLKFPFSMRL